MESPFFYRIDAARFLREMLNFRSDKERGRFIKQFALDLVVSSSANEYTNSVIMEAIEYINKKKRAGKKGGEKKASNAKAPLEQCYDSASSKKLASTEAVQNNSSTEAEALKPKVKSSPSSRDDVFLGFDEFWQCYPRKIGKGDAEKAWKKIKHPHVILFKIRDALKWQCTSEQWAKNNGEFIPHPSTYLNQRRWEDEPQLLDFATAPVEMKKNMPGRCPQCGCGSQPKEDYRECKGCGHKFKEVSNANPCG